ncbi:general substrate transporter [Coprinopsis sp. MPI-PUGE-AT-0042]|nr:general substrate transporter [Coprinopsis sp. MPI-PUGE-AT-0042]
MGFSLTLKKRQFKHRYPRWMVGKPLLYASSALASLGDAMFGYGQGVIAAAQVQPSFIKRMYGTTLTLEDIEGGNNGVDPMLQGEYLLRFVFIPPFHRDLADVLPAIVVACLNITALIASFACAYICDSLGRRMSVRIGALIYLHSSSEGAIQGFGVGMLSMTVPILQCEIAPAHGRGKFVSIEYLCLNAGYALSAWVGYGFFFEMPSELAWRGPYIVQAIPRLYSCSSGRSISPETPRWLIQHGYRKEGLQVLAELHGTGDVTDATILKEFVEIESIIEALFAIPEESMGGQSPVSSLPSSMEFNAILYFLPENLLRAGFSISRALLYAGACAVVRGLAVALAWVGALQFEADRLPIGPGRIPVADGLFAGWGPGPWLLGAEIFPIRGRAKGMALSTSVNWICNFIIAFITPPLFAKLHGGYYFLLLGSCIISGIVVWFLYPETAGKTLGRARRADKDAAVTDVRERAAETGNRVSKIERARLADGQVVKPEDVLEDVDLEEGPMLQAEKTGPHFSEYNRIWVVPRMR